MSTEFFNAIKQGNLDEVHRHFSLNSSLIYEKDNDLSPVMVAAYHQEPAIADFLAEKIINLTIFEASATGKIKQVVRLLAHDPSLANTYADDGFQPLGLACFCGHYETAEYLIKAGASINSPSRNPLSAAPIQSAVAAGHVQIMLLLLKNAADPNVRESNGFTPLHTAAQNGNLQMIHSLLFNGADMTIQNNSGKMPIDLAIEAGNENVATLLKEGITRRFRAPRIPLNTQ